MADYQLIPSHQLDIADLLRVDARYDSLSDDELFRLSPDGYHADLVRTSLAKGELFCCTDTPTLQLIFCHQSQYYINPSARRVAGEAVINALKNRFPNMDLEQPAPYQIIESLTGSGVRTNYHPPRTGPAVPIKGKLDHSPATITPVEKTVKNWLNIRFYRRDINGNKSYLQNVPYSINNKYQPVDQGIFEQGENPVDGALRYDDMPYDDFYTVYYGAPGSSGYTEEELVDVRAEHELEIEVRQLTVHFLHSL